MEDGLPRRCSSETSNNVSYFKLNIFKNRKCYKTRVREALKNSNDNLGLIYVKILLKRYIILSW